MQTRTTRSYAEMAGVQSLLQAALQGLLVARPRGSAASRRNGSASPRLECKGRNSWWSERADESNAARSAQQ